MTATVTIQELLAENERLREACKQARLALAAAFGFPINEPAGGQAPAESTPSHAQPTPQRR